MFKKFFKPFISITIGITTLFSSATIVSCIPETVIDAKGSSSVLPFMTQIRNAYQKFDDLAEINVQAGGSGLGITLIAENGTTLGNSSKNPKSTVLASEKLTQQWKNRKIKTVTLAKDGIAMLVKLPTNVDAKNLGISAANINEIYKAFAGVDHVSLSTLIHTKSNDNEKLNNINLVPFVRSGGSNVSGTAEAFLKDSHLKIKTKLDTTIKNILTNGEYGNKAITTSEANVEAYNRFKTDGQIDGSIIYLSAGYVINNLEQITNDGFTVLSYSNDDENKISSYVLPTLENLGSGKYNWVRPFNTMISIDSANTGTKKFIEFVVFNGLFGEANKTNVDNVFNSLGLIQLSRAEKLEMFKNGFQINDNVDWNIVYKDYIQDFWTDDFSLSEEGKFGIL
ncbi:phosphate transport system substrate-binding protein [Mycoplasma testudineum]|uniref:Phosphate transport system substrate-binding protein n=1 Tax=Mycoplasma testudineum TaxID=244584 RepID=A0A4R6IDT0_9MOLU|nr:substrate-binding domain-containing protein [Mycoplasma testudineum]OYD26682.1 hypothetical protein CG473_02685 [Mycoplasma testudineum]TDO19811.1 phosphate transport system substrate-binding protein [Mycoplasma testudineum]